MKRREERVRFMQEENQLAAYQALWARLNAVNEVKEEIGL